ncbi:aldo/keto reductase [Parasphingopyxis algicola]|uniref:aldo/keto reductase n=1 Tax=Parasphingopyxis algicola TaxID=2026624 RepID=UPI0015A02692|nr:aldo/keto reductase [Parasphingopyxis algicola]QLC23624.1 aldo/keto reductase [Parasphingopyxis algicola]
MTPSTPSIARTFRIGGDRAVNRLGFGAMRLTGRPGNFGPFEDWDAGIRLLRRAADLGIEFFDSARAYGPQHADRIVGEALEGRDAFLATKGGIDKFAPDRMKRDGSRDTLQREIDDALANLRRDRIDLFQLHWVDPETPLERSVEALAEAQADGRVRHIGLSNVSREELDRALAIAPIASVQNRFNMDETEQGALVDYTAGKGIAFIPYGPLGAHPMKQGAALSPRAALAWLLERSPNTVVIPGTTSIAHLEENAGVWNELA